ncbi:hypothetical protein GEV33_014365 [Tenebrio molitor]|uniref:RNA-directed DNA polymerase n=1 Tax=Tenebrio molitor TaxID=7067 RepID=A0A8J6H659_TENMO|nr:hypothetical protein GEV33_014365 [Tenebrio molitor]
MIYVSKETPAPVPCINLSDNDIMFKTNDVFARAWPCVPEKLATENVLRLTDLPLTDLPLDEIKVGPITSNQRQELIAIITEFRDCFAQSLSELGCAKSTEMEIILTEDKPFSYKPYRMARSEQEIVKNMVDKLLEHNIVRESDSNYCSPVLLVKKKNGKQRLCIDYRKLNTMTMKDNHPLPRIDDQIDRLQGGTYFTSLDLKAGYHQIPLSEDSKKYTSFVTPAGQYEYNRVPFGLTNAPRIFQRFMNRILHPAREVAAIYLDDVLLHGKTVDDALKNLRKIFEIFRNEGLTLNLRKCHFLMTSVTFLGFDIGDGRVRPGQDKTDAIEHYSPPKSVHQVRQFLGLVGYFRHFVKDFAIIAKPLTNLTKKTVTWHWGVSEEEAFRQLQRTLTTRPTLALFNPELTTEVHTDASMLGLAGILLQYQTSDTRLHPVAYFSRQTTNGEQKFHSYELETLAVVESLKKFRSYLLGIQFTVVTDCNALKATSVKKQIIPRIARWWLQLQEFSFEVKYRPGTRMKHVDALSRNPPATNAEEEEILRIEQADWVLSGQLTDQKIKDIHKILSKPPQTEAEFRVYKDYALRDGRVYRITARGIQWVVPRGMRQQVVRASHDDFGHFAVEKTLYRLSENYWFPRMRKYVEQYIACCIPCLYNKRISGKKEGFLHPIKKTAEPLNIFHVDHLGPFPRSRKGHMFIIAGIDAFTKFIFLRAAKSTKAKYVIEYFRDIFATYGVPKILISDQGTAFTASVFKTFCLQNNIKHVTNAVASPRANGQVERLNRTILSALLTSVLEEERWDEQLRSVQFAINNVVNKSTGKTASQLLFGFTPQSGTDVVLRDEVSQIPSVIEDLLTARQDAAKQIEAAQRQQKNGPMVIRKVLPNDRYVVTDMEDSHRTSKKSIYNRVIAVDHMKPWCTPGGVSDSTANESGEDGVVLSEDSDDETDE